MKQIKEHPNYYITDCGKVFSKKSNKFLKPRKHTGGYLRVSLNSKDHYIHRLVAEYFIDNPNEYKEVNHIDADKTNNNFINLEWCTRKENIKHSVKLGLNYVPNLKGENHGSSKLKKDQVIQIKELYETGNYYQWELGEMFGVCESQIGNIVRGEAWK